MDYRVGRPIAIWRTRNNMRLRIMGQFHINRNGQHCYLVQKETADHPMHGLFSVPYQDVSYE